MKLFTVTARFGGSYTTDFEAETEEQAIRFMEDELAEMSTDYLIECLTTPEFEIEDCEDIEDWED